MKHTTIIKAHNKRAYYIVPSIAINNGVFSLNNEFVSVDGIRYSHLQNEADIAVIYDIWDRHLIKLKDVTDTNYQLYHKLDNHTIITPLPDGIIEIYTQEIEYGGKREKRISNKNM